jgi:hypothetical protein
MQPSLLGALRAQQPQIRDRWTALLHVEPVSTPLANPDALVHLIDWSLQEIFGVLATTPFSSGPERSRSESNPLCPCGRNPLLAYYSAGEQAMREALILAQAASPHLDPVERDAALVELNTRLREISRREIESFCGVCQHRDEPLHRSPPSRRLLMEASAEGYRQKALGERREAVSGRQ